MIKGQDIICISTSDWQKPWGSKQQLMSKLSAENRVLYVEYQASFLHLSVLYSRFRGSNKRLRRVSGSLIVFTPYPCLPFGHYFRFINRINQKMLSLSLKRILREIGFERPVLWVYTPSASDLLGSMDAKLILYHCIADFPSEKKNRLRRQSVSLMEKELVQKSDLVLTLTDFLCEKLRTINPNTHLFRSAVDDELFSFLVNRETAAPPDIADLKRPRVGVTGYLDGRVLDIDLLCYIADARPEWSLILIGPEFRNTNNFKNLRKRRNIHFLGEKSHREIPKYISNLDVCIIPYRLNEFTNNVSPLKLYEYMAMGKPVVSARLADLEYLKGLIRVSDTKEGFVKEIALSLAEDDKGLADKRLGIAKENSWEKRLQFISGLIEKMAGN